MRTFKCMKCLLNYPRDAEHICSPEPSANENKPSVSRCGDCAQWRVDGEEHQCGAEMYSNDNRHPKALRTDTWKAVYHREYMRRLREKRR